MNVGDLIIRIGADTRGVREGVEETRIEIESLPDEHVIRIRVEEDGGGGGGGGNRRGIVDFSRRNRNLLQMIISLLPIVAAAAKVTAGSLGGLVSMLGAATVGVSGFGAVAVATLNDVFEAQKNITKANEDMRNASTEAERVTATRNLANAYKGLTTYQLAALGAMQRFKDFWDDFAASFQKPVVVLFAQSLDGLRYLLTNIAPAIRTTANAFLVMFRNMKELTKTNDFKEFFAWIGGNAGSAVSTFGAMFVNIMHGIMNVMVAFTPISNSMQGGLRGMTESFVRWSSSIKTSERFKEFVSFFLTAGPTFLTFFKQLAIFINDVVHALAPLGKWMLDVINVILALVNYLTAFVLSLASAASRARDLTNALRTLFGFQKKAAKDSTDGLIDVDQIYKDMFGSIGDVEDGINDAKKAADGFLASFDEVHNIPDFESASGGFTPPKTPTGGGTGGNPWNQPVMDDAEVEVSTNWLQKLIDKIKEIPPLIPLKIDPPDAGTGAAAVAIGSLSATVGVLTGNVNLAKFGWDAMLSGFKISLETNLPPILAGLGGLSLALIGITPVMSITALNWQTMLDTLQSKLNAYRPYLEYGLALIAAGLGNLQAAQLLLESAYSKSWQTMYANQTIQSNKMIEGFEAVQSAYRAMQATLGQPIASPATHPAGKQSLVMDDLMGSSPASSPAAAAVGGFADTLKNFDWGGFTKDWLKDLGEVGIEAALGLTGLKGAQAAGKAAEIGWPAVKQWLEGLMQGGGKAITGFASGGIIGNDSIVRVGEGGRQEAIIPLGGKAMQPFANAIASSMGGAGGGAGAGNDIVLQIDGVEFARITAKYNLQESQRIGGSMITIT